MTSIDFSKKAIVVVTGASRGIGRTIALEISRNLNQNSIIVLLARSEGDLEQTKNLIQEVDKSLTVITHAVDLATADVKTYEAILEKSTSAVDTTGIEFGIIFHNAGTTGDVKQTTDLTSYRAWRGALRPQFVLCGGAQLRFYPQGAPDRASTGRRQHHVDVREGPLQESGHVRLVQGLEGVVFQGFGPRRTQHNRL
jgi:NAD(P)-dependent dehydrogenase (short-subunit alcohol dehydrogenase family)